MTFAGAFVLRPRRDVLRGALPSLLRRRGTQTWTSAPSPVTDNARNETVSCYIAFPSLTQRQVGLLTLLMIDDSPLLRPLPVHRNCCHGTLCFPETQARTASRKKLLPATRIVRRYVVITPGCANVHWRGLHCCEKPAIPCTGCRNFNSIFSRLIRAENSNMKMPKINYLIIQVTGLHRTFHYCSRLVAVATTFSLIFPLVFIDGATTTCLPRYERDRNVVYRGRDSIKDYQETGRNWTACSRVANETDEGECLFGNDRIYRTFASIKERDDDPRVK